MLISCSWWPGEEQSLAPGGDHLLPFEGSSVVGRCWYNPMLDAVFVGALLRRDSKDANLEFLLRLQAFRSCHISFFKMILCVYSTCWIKETQHQKLIIRYCTDSPRQVCHRRLIALRAQDAFR